MGTAGTVGVCDSVLAAGLEDKDSAQKYLGTLAGLDFGYRDVAQRLDKLAAPKDNSSGG